MNSKHLFLIVFIIGIVLFISGIYLLSNNLQSTKNNSSDEVSDETEINEEEREYYCINLDDDKTSDDFKITNVKLCFKENLEITFDLSNNTDEDYTDIQVEFYLNVPDNAYNFSIAIDSINSGETNNIVYTDGYDKDFENVEGYDFEMNFSQLIGG